MAHTIDLPVELKNSTVSVIVSDVETGEIILEHQSEQSATPASITKLITTATALELLGPDFRFTTLIAHDGTLVNGILKGNLYIIGSGDPTLGSTYFNEEKCLSNWAKNLQNMGITEIQGDIIADASLFDKEPLPVRWTWEDIGNYYAAGVYGLSVFDNTTHITLRSKNIGSKPEIIEVKPAYVDLKLENCVEVTSIKFDSTYLYGIPYDQHRVLRGAMPAHREKFVVKGDIPNPPLYLVQQLKRELTQRHITVKGSATDQITSIESRTTLFTHHSPKLSEICRVINFFSNNNYAEHLFKQLSLQRNPLATNKEAQEVILNFWRSKGIDTQPLLLNDGSGLSPMNTFSAKFLNAILSYMIRSSNSQTFIETIPRAGVEGTVKNFLKNPAISTYVRAKSGSMTGVQTYAGYIHKPDNIYSFCIIINHYNGSRMQLRKTIETWLLPILK
ncbi:MAG TPA: D-alanyl-D-alanine carboxypeptidase/D-alanyl-D-alanine-endopeptidase [Paludibacteraceae bacterium]|nr:D-alanyl-D-alanine carboxypeptidase/D-alanyl-D-alanine-endopeptidase [Paludibacteraceae bacterium]HQB69335.1 D-alanyl-D-alanine carboxypeptidase/D-alanyl-D-alanine-endopeptidase [Paludibacteraceae bacterium]HRS67589.1 D-alanyl-D-alanine carboxypeptidase/D-alanyl-D-alanine-endopeptidase [Paludibacteraceae bacterium]